MSNLGKLTILILSCLVLQIYADADACAPRQVTLSLGDKHYRGPRTNVQNVTLDLARIVWVTQSTCSNGTLTIVRVNSTETPKGYGHRVEEYSQYINITHKGKTSEGQYTRYSHIAELVDIKPETFYTATITSGGETTSFRFKIPDMNKKDKPLTFLHYADFDNGNISKPTFQALRSLLANESTEIDFSLFNGDLAYEISDDAGKRGDSFYEDYQSIATTRPMVFAPGNHEWFYNFSLLNYRTKMPLFNETNNHYYSWDMGSVHFIQFNYDFYDVVDEATQKRMYDWIENDLRMANASENRTQRPWIVAYTHRPIYCSTNMLSDKEEGRCYSFYPKRKIWDELLYKYRVDLLLSGHVHSYERMGAVYQNHSMSYESYYDSQGVQTIKNPTATVHIVDGSAGNDYFMQDEPIVPNNYSIKGDLNISYSIVTVHNDSVISFKHIKSSDGSIIDQFYLKRDRPSTGMPAWAIVLIVVGVVSVLAGVGIYFYKKSKSSKNSSVVWDTTDKSTPIMRRSEDLEGAEGTVYSAQSA